MKYLSFEIVIEREEDPAAGYTANCPTLPGCSSNGRSIEEAKKNIREAIALHLESLQAHSQKIPQNDRIVHVEELAFALPS